MSWVICETRLMQLFFHNIFVFGVVLFVVSSRRSVSCAQCFLCLGCSFSIVTSGSRTFITILNTINDIVVLSSGQPRVHMQLLNNWMLSSQKRSRSCGTMLTPIMIHYLAGVTWTLFLLTTTTIVSMLFLKQDTYFICGFPTWF